MYIIALIFLNLLFQFPSGFPEWAAQHIVLAVGSDPTPVRIVWNQQSPPVEVESSLLKRGLALTTSIAAPRIEITTTETRSGDIELSLRSMDADGIILRSEKHRYSNPKTGWRKHMDRYAAPVFITAATGLTVYLLYNVRSR